MTFERNKISGNSRKLAKKQNVFEDGSDFGNLLIKNGALLKQNSFGILLDKDPSSFKQQLSKSLKLHLDFPAIIDDAVQSISKHFEDDDIIKSFLTPVLLNGDKENTATTFGLIGLNDCFLKILLNIEILQHKLMIMLLDRIVRLCKKERQDDESVCMAIIKQFCWLDVIAEPEELVTKLFETAKECPAKVQEAVILSLPEIINDAQHPHVARSLINLLKSDPKILLTVVNALDNLNIPDDCLIEMKRSVTDMLATAEVEEMTVILKFTFQHVTREDANEMIEKIRKNIKLSCDIYSRPASTPLRQSGAVRKKEATKSAFALLIETLKPLPFYKTLSSAWLKNIEELKDSEDVQPIDIFILLILHSSNDQRKVVEGVIRNKVMSGIVTSAHMCEVFSIRPEIMEDFFKSLMQLAELFLKSLYGIVIRFACDLYRLAFDKLNSYCQQEVVGVLVSHIGSGCSTEIDLTLDVLVDLVDNYIDKMVPYAAFINGILDYLDNLDLGQVKKLYQVLARMAFCSQHGLDIQDGLHIIITKQLSSHIMRYQQVGVVGGLMVAKNLSIAGSVDDANMSYSMNRSRMTHATSVDHVQQVKDIIELVKSNAQKSPQLLALFYEELAVLIRTKCLGDDIEKWIADKAEEDFQVNFVADLQEGNSTNAGEPGEMVWKVQFMLDEVAPGEEDFVINIAPLVAMETENAGSIPTGRSSVWCLSSCFRLLHTCQSTLKENNLEDIDALLGCGIKLQGFPTRPDQLDSSSPKEKLAILHSAFVVVNWFRELMNGFCSQEKPHMKEKVVSRLHSVVSLHCLIERMLLDYPDYRPPPNVYSSNLEDVQGTGLVVVPKSKAKPKKPTGRPSKSTKPGKGRKRPRSDSQDEENEEEPTSQLDVPINSTPSSTGIAKATSINNSINKSSFKSVATINKSLLSACFRELDMDVFQIFSFTKLSSPGIADDEFSEIKLKLEPSALIFLLDDLLLKLSRSLSKSSEKRNPFFKAKSDQNSVGFNNLNLIGPLEVANKVCYLIPHLCRYLESLSAYFQVSAEKLDETCDMSCFELDENKSMTRSLSLLVRVFVTFFSWGDLPSHKKLLRSSISHLSRRMSSSTVRLQDEFKQAFDYVEKFSKTIQDVSGAIQLCKLLSCFTALSALEELNTRTGDVSMSFLKQKWREEDKKTDFNMAIGVLLSMSFKHSKDAQQLTEVFISSALPEFLQSEDCSQTFPTLNKDSLPVYYKLLLFYLCEHAKTIPAGTIHTSLDENMEKILNWSASVKLFRVLIDLLKTFDSRSNIASALKYGRKFVDLFMRQCIPTLDLLLLTNRDEVQNLFKTLQQSTRSLHHLCSHSKIKKDISLTNQVPQLKCTLESLIRRVKDMLNKNKCVAAFWLGNLKNRDLKGAEILSQATNPSESDDDDADDDGRKKNEGVGSKASDLISSDCEAVVEESSDENKMDLRYDSDIIVED